MPVSEVAITTSTVPARRASVRGRPRRASWSTSAASKRLDLPSLATVRLRIPRLT